MTRQVAHDGAALLVQDDGLLGLLDDVESDAAHHSLRLAEVHAALVHARVVHLHARDDQLRRPTRVPKVTSAEKGEGDNFGEKYNGPAMTTFLNSNYPFLALKTSPFFQLQHSHKNL